MGNNLNKTLSQEYLLQDFLSQWHKGNGIKVCTSGSTGTPKEIILSNDMMARSARRTNRHFGITKSSHLHSAISFEYIGGKMMIVRSILAGCRLSFSSPSLSPSLPEDGGVIDLISVVPAQMMHILDHLEDYGNVKNFLIGGSSIDSRLWDRIVEAGLNAWESYGMTETASHIALRRVTGNSKKRPRFVPLNGVKVKSDFEDRLHINMDNEFFPTNDLTTVFPDGSFIINGRIDNMIISGGLKINPVLLERTLQPYLEGLIDTFFISSSPDERWTSKIILVAKPAIAPTVSSENLQKKIKDVLDGIPSDILSPKFRPKEVRIMDELTYTDSGKLLRKL